MSLIKKIRVLCCAASVAAGIATAYSGQYKFSENSRLAQGRWIKVEVKDAGVYELSDSRLRDMGLDPENVSVFGQGGKTTSYDMVSGGKNNVADDLVQVPVYRNGNKIYFYGQGLSNPRIGSSGYVFDEQNTFGNCGHYFLTDGVPTLDMAPGEKASDLKPDAVDCSSGYDYRINNDDRIQGLERAGLLYWDYGMKSGETRTWNVPVDYLQEGRQATLSTKAMLFCTSNAGTGATADMTLNIAGSGHQVRYTQPPGVNKNGMDFQGSASREIDRNANAVGIGVTLNGSNNADIYFDWWMLNYPKRITATDTGLTQQRLGTFCPDNQNGYVEVNDTWVVMDVTDPAAPVVLNQEKGKAYFRGLETGLDLMVFNPTMPQLIPENPVVVANQNLHAVQDCSFLIITVPEFRDYAEEIAQLHREHDGINVAVASIDEVYNEFTGGNPHPMAYRMLVKMLYERKGEPLKNVLLLGPIRSDARNIHNTPYMPGNFLIGMQEGGALAERVPALTMGFYGNTDDNLPPTAQESAQMHVGVGLLPVNDSEDCKLAVSKIRRYLDELNGDGMAWLVNESMSLGCSGDDHIHDNQAYGFGINISNNAINAGAGSLRHTTLIPDFYFYDNATDLVKNNLNQGKLISLYIGHSTDVGLGAYLGTGDFIQLKNRIPSFMMFSGCDQMLPDQGASGLVMESVLHASRGLIGAIGSTRMAWANQNYQLALSLAESLYKDRNGYYRINSPTMGEVYARAKSSGTVTGSNKLVYEYIGDPALVIPVPLRGIGSKFNGNLRTFRAGDVILVNGVVSQNAGDKAFNGTAVLKLCQPTQRRTQPSEPNYAINVSDVLVTSITVNVENGTFSAKIPMTEECDRFLSTTGSTNNMHLYISAYDPSQRLGASGYKAVPMAKANRDEKPGDDETDNVAPVVYAEFDADTDILTLSTTDNVGFVPGIGNGAGTILKIDDKPVVMASDAVGTGGVTDYSACIYVGDYTIGKHTARFSSVDLMGNKTDEQTYDFTIGHDNADIELTMPKTYVIDSVDFIIDSKGRSGLVLVVFDADGRRVYQETDVDGMVTWDCSGQKAGVYRAAVQANDGRKCRSQWVTFSVMD